MKNQLLRWSTCLVLVLSACTRQEPPKGEARDYFITENLDFLAEEIDAGSSKGWPATGCKELRVKVKIPLLGDVSTSFYHCCVNYACNLQEINNILDFFIGDKSASPIREIEIVSSEMNTFRQYDFRIRPGKYSVNLKTGKLERLQYEVWVNRN